MENTVHNALQLSTFGKGCHTYMLQTRRSLICTHACTHTLAHSLTKNSNLASEYLLRVSFVSGTACTAQHTIAGNQRTCQQQYQPMASYLFKECMKVSQHLVMEITCTWVCVYQKRGKIHIQVCDTVQPKMFTGQKISLSPATLVLQKYSVE